MSSVLNEKDIYRMCAITPRQDITSVPKPYCSFLVEMIQMKKGEPENWTKLAKTHVIRHSYSHWSGIAAALIVEQLLSPKYRWPLP